MTMIQRPYRWLYDDETMADHPRPHYLLRVIPPGSLYDSVDWQKFYDPQSEPMGVPKLCVLTEEDRHHMDFERDQYLRSVVQKWLIRFITLAGSLLAVVAFFSLLVYLSR